MIGSDIVYLNMAYIYSKKIVALAQILEKTVFYIHKIFSFRKQRAGVENETEKILILEPFKPGDVASVSVMIEPIKDSFPGASIFILTQARNENIFEYDQRVNVLTSEFPWSDYKNRSKRRCEIADCFINDRLQGKTGLYRLYEFQYNYRGVASNSDC
jgi:hypothetical protein